MSIADRPDGIAATRPWRCPECRTLQAATTRCWRCQQPAFSCGTCCFFRPSVAAGLGTCAQDPAQVPLAADEIRSCWEPTGGAGSDAGARLPELEPAGLFAEDEFVLPAPRPPLAPEPARKAARADRTRRRAKPPLEEPGRAAWVESDGGALVDAPTIEPGKRLSTEVQRRRRRWFG